MHYFKYLLFVLSAALLGYLALKTPVADQIPAVPEVPIITNTPVSEEVVPTVTEKYNVVSPDGAYKLSITSLSGICSYKLESLNADAINFGSSIGCSVIPIGGQGGYVSNLIVWLDNSTVMLNDPAAHTLLFLNADGSSLHTATINYSGVYDEFLGVSLDMSKLLWGKAHNTPDSKSLYTLTDKTLKILTSFIIEQEDLKTTVALFVPQSNGILFMKHFSTNEFTPASVISLIDENNGCQCKPGDPSCNLEWHEFVFFNFDNQVLKTVLSSSKDLDTICGRGCYGPEVINSDDSNITLKVDCFNIDKKYYDEKGQIKLNIL